MAMPNDEAAIIDLLRSSEVVGVRVHEVPRLHVLDCHLNREVGVGLDRRKVLGELEYGGYGEYGMSGWGAGRWVHLLQGILVFAIMDPLR